MKKGLIQVAGVIDRAEANMLLQAGVDWLGFPLRLPVHQEDLSEAAAGRIIREFTGTSGRRADYLPGSGRAT